MTIILIYIFLVFQFNKTLSLKSLTSHTDQFPSKNRENLNENILILNKFETHSLINDNQLSLLNDTYQFEKNYNLNKLINFTENESEKQNLNTLYDVPVYLILILAFAYGLVSLTAVLGNSIVLWFVVRSKKLRTVTNIFIANLAIADILIGALAIPFQFQAALLQRWVLPHFFCSFCSFIQIVSVNVSIFTLSAIAADRYLVVFYPINYRITKKVAKIIVFFIWFFAILAAIPSLIALKVVYVPDLRNISLNQQSTNAFIQAINYLNKNYTDSFGLTELQKTLNVSSSFENSLNNSALSIEHPNSKTIFLIDDFLAKIDLTQNKDDKLGLFQNNFTLPTKAHCGNVGLSTYYWKMYNLFLVLIQYFIPLIVITFAYSRMGLKLKLVEEPIEKRNSAKNLKRINTNSSGGFSISSFRTNNNLNYSPCNANLNFKNAFELKEKDNIFINQNDKKSKLKKLSNSNPCSPLEENKIFKRNSSLNKPQSNLNINKSLIKKHPLCIDNEIIMNNNNDLLKNNNVDKLNSSCLKKICKCNIEENVIKEEIDEDFNENIKKENQKHSHHYQNQLNSKNQQFIQLEDYKKNIIQHESRLKQTGSVHSSLMMPIISKSISSLRDNPQAEYIVINKKKVVKMLFIVVALFAFCWLPLQTYNLLEDIFVDINKYRYINLIWFVFHWLAMSNSSVNPFIYAIYTLRN
uniref:Tachykinin-like peptide receptor 99D n=1 Tax=Polyphagotarsonemus latus TaxID=1204166 RepID=A0AAN0N7B3_9ACAR